MEKRPTLWRRLAISDILESCEKGCRPRVAEIVAITDHVEPPTRNGSGCHYEHRA